jgi:DNA-binding response OmpR family regulator
MGLDSFAIMEPDMVLLDLKMPDIDGIHVLKAIRGMGNVPVVVMTAYPSELSQIYLSGLKVEACLEKPLQLEKLLAIMKSTGARHSDEGTKKI